MFVGGRKTGSNRLDFNGLVEGLMVSQFFLSMEMIQ